MQKSGRGLSPLPPVQAKRLWERRSTWLVAIALLFLVLIVPRLHFRKSAKPHPHPAAHVANVNVSRAGNTQAEVTVAVDPRNPRLLIAAANDWDLGVNSWISKDGGATWTANSAEPIAPGCPDADPALAFDLRGRAYLAVLGRAACGSDPERVYVTRRRSIAKPWVRITAPVAGGTAKITDDKPAMAVDRGARSPHRNRIYVGWARTWEIEPGDVRGAIVITHSDDGGRTWARLSRVSPATQLAFSASIAIAPNGHVYIAWDDPGNRGIWIDRAPDGVHFGVDRLVAAYLLVGEKCDVPGAAIPAQPHRCVGPNPIVTLDTDAPMQVLVTYGSEDDADHSQSVFLVAFDKTLRHMIVGRPALQKGVRITPPEPHGSRADQFWPVSAFDATTKRLWVCFYDTTGDRSRRTASYSCMVALYRGRRWLGPVRVAEIASDETQLGARKFEYGDYEGLAVSRGVAHPVWTDSRRLQRAREEVYIAALSEADVERATRGRGGP